jgi:hypothetical protein
VQAISPGGACEPYLLPEFAGHGAILREDFSKAKPESVEIAIGDAAGLHDPIGYSRHQEATLAFHDRVLERIMHLLDATDHHDGSRSATAARPLWTAR